MMIKKIFAIVLCSLCCGFVSAQTYTLEQLKDSALHNNFAIRSARYDMEAASQQRKEAFTKYFPNVSGTGLWFNANKAMAQTSFNLSEMMPPELSTSLAPLTQLLPPEALAALAEPVVTSWPKWARMCAGCRCNSLKMR